MQVYSTFRDVFVPKLKLAVERELKNSKTAGVRALCGSTATKLLSRLQVTIWNLLGGQQPCRSALGCTAYCWVLWQSQMI